MHEAERPPARSLAPAPSVHCSQAPAARCQRLLPCCWPENVTESFFMQVLTRVFTVKRVDAHEGGGGDQNIRAASAMSWCENGENFDFTNISFWKYSAIDDTLLRCMHTLTYFYTSTHASMPISPWNTINTHQPCIHLLMHPDKRTHIHPPPT